jgi:hypothetical protein
MYSCKMKQYYMTLNNWVLCGYILNKWEEKQTKMVKKVYIYEYISNIRQI